MNRFKIGGRKGIPIQILHVLMIFSAAAVAVLLLFSSFQIMNVFSRLSGETGNYIVRQKAAHDLMEASDYLTEMVQRFTLEGDTTYLNNYFEEAFVSKRREASILTMSDDPSAQDLVQQLQEAMDESQSLMYREYYAMKLVIEAQEITDYPETLQAIELSEEDSFLAPEDKMNLAQDMVMGTEYYASKDIIHTKLKSNLETLDDMMSKTRQVTSADMMRQLSSQRLVAIILTVILIIMIILVAVLAVLPLRRAAKSIARRETLPVEGAREMRELAADYNEMYHALRRGGKAADEAGADETAGVETVGVETDAAAGDEADTERGGTIEKEGER